MNRKGLFGLGDFDVGTLAKVLFSIFFISIFVGIVLNITGLTISDLVGYSSDLFWQVIQQIPIIGPLLSGGGG